MYEVRILLEKGGACYEQSKEESSGRPVSTTPTLDTRTDNFVRKD